MSLNVENYRAKFSFLQTAQVWPLTSRFNAEGWLRNFSSSDERLAMNLLNSFTYFNEEMVNQLLRASIQAMAFAARESSVPWSTYIDSTIFTFVKPENAHPVASGHEMLRRIRDKLGIPSAQILNPAPAIDEAVASGRILVFVDDILGTGDQFISHWRGLRTSDGRSVADLCRSSSLKVAFCCLISTAMGRNRVLEICSGLQVYSAQIIDETYTLLSENSRFWKPEIRTASINRIREISMEAGIIEGRPLDYWMGYGKLGLSVGFAHGVPDFTLPIFTHASPQWIPLVSEL